MKVFTLAIVALSTLGAASAYFFTTDGGQFTPNGLEFYTAQS